MFCSKCKLSKELGLQETIRVNINQRSRENTQQNRAGETTSEETGENSPEESEITNEGRHSKESTGARSGRRSNMPIRGISIKKKSPNTGEENDATEEEIAEVRVVRSEDKKFHYRRDRRNSKYRRQNRKRSGNDK